ncbi:MAG: hypothetical protein M1832_005995 [Thelocarpon impressellum]|nr:MAG: hypothetical protein M1832_005995 [Thelocarpon impressellum]
MAPTVILIRHAEAEHNATNDIHDPPLTPQGFEQCETLRAALQDLPIAQKIDLVVASPMRRTIQTALRSLGWKMEGEGVPVVLMAEWQENSDKPCDVGSPPASLAPAFPSLPAEAFETIHPLFPSKTGSFAYTEPAILARGTACRAWLRARPEAVVAVVSHSGFLRVGVSNAAFGNADYRVFDCAGSDDAAELVEWESTRDNGGGLGCSDRGWFGVESQRWPAPRGPTVDEQKRVEGEAVEGEAVEEVPR